MKKKNKNNLLPVIGWRANEEEREMLTVVRQHFMRSSNSDILRFLVVDAYKKILNENCASAQK
jgi:hypothetical protein